MQIARLFMSINSLWAVFGSQQIFLFSNMGRGEDKKILNHKKGHHVWNFFLAYPLPFLLPFCLFLCQIHKNVLKMIWKWAENGPIIATVNNPIYAWYINIQKKEDETFSKESYEKNFFLNLLYYQVIDTWYLNAILHCQAFHYFLSCSIFLSIFIKSNITPSISQCYA